MALILSAWGFRGRLVLQGMLLATGIIESWVVPRIPAGNM